MADLEEAPDRRAFLRGAARTAVRGSFTAAALVGFLTLRDGRTMPLGARGRLGIVRPPGSLEEETDFLASCIRCRRCADACEAQCIQFFGPETGARYGTPYILPVDRGCTLCLKCGDACPSGAIEPLAEIKDSRMGVAVVDERLCVAYIGDANDRICGVCHAACPLRGEAITLVDEKPVVHTRHCVGCGLCEEVCVVKDRRAIQMRSPRKWVDFDRA